MFFKTPWVFTESWLTFLTNYLFCCAFITVQSYCNLLQWCGYNYISQIDSYMLWHVFDIWISCSALCFIVYVSSFLFWFLCYFLMVLSLSILVFIYLFLWFEFDVTLLVFTTTCYLCLCFLSNCVIPWVSPCFTFPSVQILMCLTCVSSSAPLSCVQLSPTC